MKTMILELWDATNKRVLFMLVLLASILMVFNILTGGYILRSENMANLFRQVSVVAILAVGMTLVIVLGNVDLSVGSALGMFGALTAALIAQYNMNPLYAVPLVIIVGFLVGCLHGAFVHYLKVPAFVVTLGGLIAYRGVTQYVARQSIPVRVPWIKSIAQSYTSDFVSFTLLALVIIIPTALIFISRFRMKKADLPVQIPLWVDISKILVLTAASILIVTALINGGNSGIPIQSVILLVIAVVVAAIAKNTTFGHYVYAIGGNEQAARYSGISISRNTILVFGLMTMLAAICGIITISELSAAAPDIGDLKELEAIAACVIGGASLMGGSGTIGMSVLGAMIMASIKNGMSMLGVVAQTQKIILGSVLLLAVALDQWSRRGKRS